MNMRHLKEVFRFLKRQKPEQMRKNREGNTLKGEE